MGLTALDSGVLIGFLDSSDAFHKPAVAAMINALAAGSVVLPSLAYAESSVAVLRAGSTIAWFDGLLGRLAITVGNCNIDVAAAGAQLRASALTDRRKRQWRLPDALIVAEAAAMRADQVVTTDRSWPEPPSPLRIKVLDPSRPPG